MQALQALVSAAAANGEISLDGVSNMFRVAIKSRCCQNRKQFCLSTSMIMVLAIVIDIASSKDVVLFVVFVMAVVAHDRNIEMPGNQEQPAAQEPQVVDAQRSKP
jgi:hypothetical protein